MKLQKHDPQTDMAMNMTPMIDVVFLLIIFFMIITDMTQQDLEDIELPVAVSAEEDKPDPDEFRPIVNIDWLGRMVAKRDLVYDPTTAPDDWSGLQKLLVTYARLMETAPMTEDEPSSPQIPDEPLLIRADRSTPFYYLQKIMELCGQEGIRIWKVQLAAAEDEEKTKEPES